LDEKEEREKKIFALAQDVFDDGVKVIERHVSFLTKERMKQYEMGGIVIDEIIKAIANRLRKVLP